MVIARGAAWLHYGAAGVVAPAKTPAVVISRPNAAFTDALHDSAVAKKLGDVGVVITPQTFEQFGQFIGIETELWSRLIKSAGTKAN